ncbi:MAG: hypothetical protein QOF59_780 [Actinomycetota bacterium]|jgi:transglutaminase-like putative cysteine protease|nr:hypothetical protein [Actinomycetota bacterium]MDQ1478140.1 hypothetical protein [Actinomycetota bacterium]
MVSDEIDFYAEPGPMTGLAELDDALAGMPSDPAAVAAVVQGLVVHPFWASSYDVEVTPEREGELQTRAASGMLERILEIDGRPLTEPREPRSRFVGNCRHFSTLTVALLRRAHVPSRARCGFAGYFDTGKWVDHWVVEHWDGSRWVMLDAQLDELQRRAVGLTADSTDLPPGMFLPAGDAWRRCRAGQENGDSFGILDMWGQWFIVANIARDLAALNKVEMLPWDGWGDLGRMGDTPGGDAYVDEVAALTVSNDHQAIRQRYETSDGLRVPARVTAFYTPAGPTEVDIPELI